MPYHWREWLPEGVGAGKQHLFLSYGVNSWYYDDGRPEHSVGATNYVLSDFLYADPYRSSNDFKDAANTILITEAEPWEGYIPTIYGPQVHDYCSPHPKPGVDGIPLKGMVSLRHNDGFNVLFVDTHVKWLRQTTWQMWAADPEKAKQDPALKPCIK